MTTPGYDLHSLADRDGREINPVGILRCSLLAITNLAKNGGPHELIAHHARFALIVLNNIEHREKYGLQCFKYSNAARAAARAATAARAASSIDSPKRVARRKQSEALMHCIDVAEIRGRNIEALLHELQELLDISDGCHAVSKHVRARTGLGRFLSGSEQQLKVAVEPFAAVLGAEQLP